MINTKLKSELLDMVAEDQLVRSKLVDNGELFRGYPPMMAEVHLRNSWKLDAMVTQHGWPGRSLVGKDGTEAAWLVLLHAIGNPALQRKCLPLLKKSAESGEIDAAQVAYLEDRICVMERRPQRYGTQFDWDENGQLSPCPLQDPDQVDAWRASVGLGPLYQMIEQQHRRAELEGETPPTDYEQRRLEMDAWARSVGWR